MLFNSHIFILGFLPIAILLHDLCRSHPALRRWVIFGLSMAFYVYWIPWHSVLLLVSLLINLAVGEWLARDRARLPLVLGLVFNLGYLGVFKYADFILENLGVVTQVPLPQLGWVLPLGISFYTFQQMSYLLDIHSGLIKTRRASTFLAYIVFFPQLIAGPIVRYTDVHGHLEKSWGSEEQWLERCRGLFVFVVGLSKKLFIADSIAPYVDTWHAALAEGYQPALLEAWFIVLAYPFQLYFDFSGYSDMAWGLALMFGIRISWNFNSPFHAVNMSDFWQRWHISLSQCFQRYLFNPLAMALRHQPSVWVKQIFPFLITMTLIGFWHGAGWTFILWGFFHGVFLSVAYLNKTRWKRKLPRRLSWAITFLCVMLVFVWFRSDSVGAALELLSGCFGGNGLVLPRQLVGEASGWVQGSWYLFPALHDHRTWEPILACVPAWLLAWKGPNAMALADGFRLSARHMAWVSLGLVLCLLKINEVSVFLYYQF